MSLSLPLLRSITRYSTGESWKVIFTSKRCLALAEEDPFIWTNILNNPIFSAAEFGNLRWIKHLLYYDLFLNEFDDDFFEECVSQGHLDILKYLYHRGLLNDLVGILKQACWFGQGDIIKWMTCLGVKLPDQVIHGYSNKIKSMETCDLHVVKWVNHNVEQDWGMVENTIRFILGEGNLSVVKYLNNVIKPSKEENFGPMHHFEHLDAAKIFRGQLDPQDTEFFNFYFHETLDSIKFRNFDNPDNCCSDDLLIESCQMHNLLMIKWFCMNKKHQVIIDEAISTTTRIKVYTSEGKKTVSQIRDFLQSKKFNPEEMNNLFIVSDTRGVTIRPGTEFYIQDGVFHYLNQNGLQMTITLSEYDRDLTLGELYKKYN